MGALAPRAPSPLLTSVLLGFLRRLRAWRPGSFRSPGGGKRHRHCRPAPPEPRAAASPGAEGLPPPPLRRETPNPASAAASSPPVAVFSAPCPGGAPSPAARREGAGRGRGLPGVSLHLRRPRSPPSHLRAFPRSACQGPCLDAPCSPEPQQPCCVGAPSVGSRNVVGGPDLGWA